MNCLPLLAALLLSQVDPAGSGRSAVDVAYRPKVGDFLLLGMTDPKEEEAGRPGKIGRAEVYRTKEECLLALDINGDGDSDRISAEPECLCVRACTAARVHERALVDSRLEGRPSKAIVYRVELLEGGFRDRLVWVAGYQVFRFKGPAGAAVPTRKSGLGR